MPIDFPSFEEIVQRVRADISSKLPDLDPTIFGSFARALGDAIGGRAYSMNNLQKQLLRQLFPQTADDEYLELWANYEGITRNAATGSNGYVNFSGTAATAVPLGTMLTSATGEEFTTDFGIAMSAQSVSVSSLTRSGTQATATTSSDHQFATGQSITISGANEAEYNGTFVITVTDTDEFTFTVSGSPATPATGTILAGYTGASVTVTSSGAGQQTNLETGAYLTLVSPIAGINQKVYIQFAGVSGGTDAETQAELLSRVLQSRSNPVANFNEAAIEKAARGVAGVTRVKVKRITPEVGDVTILFVRDNDTNIIPSAGEVADVFDAIFAISPANTASSSVIVAAPAAVTTDFTFTAISPDSDKMRAAIENSLNAFYRDSVNFEENISEDKYRAAIIDTIDPDTGDELISFTLSAPSGDITVSTNQIGVLGAITF